MLGALGKLLDFPGLYRRWQARWHLVHPAPQSASTAPAQPVMAAVPRELPGSPATAAQSRFPFVLVGVWLLATVYLAFHIDRGWVPHDEGVLAQSAERVLQGELPHRDFNDPYTGGLSLLHALAFAVFGVRLIALRWVLLLFAAAWIPALYYVASRFVPPLAAGAAVLLATVWGIPNYPAAMPSWYNLFLATFGAAALLRYLETERRRWLLAAGVAGGLSVVVKISGLSYVAGTALFLLYREQCLSLGPAGSPGRRPDAYRVAAAGAIVTFVALLVTVVIGRLGLREFVHFVMPGGAIAALLLRDEFVAASPPSSTRFAALGRLLLPFALGVAAVVVPFLATYVRAGAVSELLAGVFARPVARLSVAAMRPPAILPSLDATLPLALLLAAGSRTAWWGTWARFAIAAALGAGLVAAADQPAAYRFVWYSVRALVPVATVAGVGILLHPRLGRSLSRLRRQQLVLLLSVTAMVSLVQFPFSATVYFCYVAPLLVLAIVAILASVGGVRSFAAASACAFYLLFAARFLNRTSVFTMGEQYTPEGQITRLVPPRGTIRVPAAEQALYARLVAAVRQRSSGDYIYATPDCPEVYFLTGKRNPTPSLFEFLDREASRPERLLAVLAQRGVDVVVLNRLPDFSPDVDPTLAAALAARFPDSLAVGDFLMRWRS